jgi:hypothetical protein
MGEESEASMDYVNCGAKILGQRIKTKKALKEAMKNDPGSVSFDETSMFNTARDYSGNDIPRGIILSVVGPDPYTKRSWYASVTSDGKVS